MNSRCFLYLLAATWLPLTATAQSYVWSDRTVSEPRSTNFQVEATEYGIYSVGEIQFDGYQPAPGWLSKFRADDGKLLWRRKVALEAVSPTRALTVDPRGVFVVGGFSDSVRFGSFVRGYDHDGNILWTVRDRHIDEFALAIDSDADGLYVVGRIRLRAVLRHLDFDGRLVWSRVLPPNTPTVLGLAVDNGFVYVAAGRLGIEVYRTNGDFVRRVSFDGFGGYDMVVRDGFIYTTAYDGVTKYSRDGDEIWKLHLHEHPTAFGWLAANDSTIAASDEGLFITPRISDWGGPPGGLAIVKLDFDGAILDVKPMFGHQRGVSLSSISTHEGALYVAGNDADYPAASAFTARYSDEPLLEPSLLALQGAAPAQPPRLAVLYHDYGAGPVQVGIRDAVPGSFEYVLDFDDDLTPVAFGKIADLNANGYEELVVVSRLPAVAEVRDSLDGRVISRIKFGKQFVPLAAIVEERAGELPRLAVAVRNPANGRRLVRVHDLASGALLETLAYNPNFDPVDMAALPGTSAAHGYALLSRNPLEGTAHKIEVRQTNSTQVQNFWIGGANGPLQLVVRGPAGQRALAALFNDPGVQRPGVRQVDLQTDVASTVYYSRQFIPVAMAELPDADGNGYPQIAVLSETPDRKTKTESRDAQSGVLDRQVKFDNRYRPQDLVYLGAVPGFSDSAMAVVGLPREWGFGGNTPAPARAEVVAVDGTELFHLDFLFGM